MDRFPVPETVKAFSEVFRKNDFSLYVVGGAVRDYLLGIENHDYDFCTDALAEEVCKMFHAVIPTGIKHGTVTVLFRGQSFEVTTFRTETDYSDHRHPDGVSFVRTLDEDLSRRDFTVNAFAADCTTGEITDIFNGREDLKNRVIRAIGEPKQRFREDALRLLRMCRFCSKLGFEPDRITFSAAQSLASSISYVSQERIYDELSKILKSTKPSVGLRLAEDCGLISYILPELAECRNTKQEKTGSSDVLEHIYNAVDAAASAGYCHEVRLACLLHDIGKPSSMTVKDGVMKFYGHDTSGAEMAVKVMKRLKCSNKTIDEVHTIIANHMVRYSRDWTDGAVKRFMCRIGSEVTIHHLFEMQWCDQIASEGKSKEAEYAEFIERIHLLKEQPMSVKDLAVNGDDLASIGIQKSKKMGIILQNLLETVIDNPEKNKKEILLDIAKFLAQIEKNVETC